MRLDCCRFAAAAAGAGGVAPADPRWHRVTGGRDLPADNQGSPLPSTFPLSQSRLSHRRITEGTFGLQEVTRYLQTGILYKLHTALAVICLAVLLPMLGWFSRAVWRTRTVPWTRRQRYIVAVVLLELVVQVTAAHAP